MNATNKILVLVVDDQEASRSGLVKLLREHGFEVDEADNGQKAFALLGRHFFSVVITVMSMPNGNGIELLKRAKELHETTCVFLMSDYPDLYADDKDFDFLDGVFKKPVNPEEVVRAVELACGNNVISSSLAA